MAFFECEFPRTVAFERLGGDSFSTNINEGFGGQEQRNRNWSLTKAQYTVDANTPAERFADRQQFIECLHDFFDVVGGRADAFRFYDHLNCKALGQMIGVGTGSTLHLQLTRTYRIGSRSYVRNLTKIVDPSVINYQGAPLPTTLAIYFNGLVQPTGAYTLDATTGIVTCTPSDTVVVSADCQFHIPVRFNTDKFPALVKPSDVPGGKAVIELHALELMEVPPPNY